MPVPKHVFDPPFNIIRSSHVVLDVNDLKASRAFYETAVGLHVEDADNDVVYLRGSEEHQHHSLVLRKAQVAACNRLGFKVGNEGDLDKAASFFSENGIQYKFAEQPFQGRTLQFTDPFGFQIELYAAMDKRPHLLRRYDLYKGCHPQRLDHFNIFAAEVQDTMDFYARLGFRLTEYAEEDGPNGRIAAAWLHRKGNVHDLAITNGKGPRLHHFCYWVPTAMNVLHLCDVMAASGYLKNLERGPGRHGISNAFFLYVRDPDGHRLELYTSDYFTDGPRPRAAALVAATIPGGRRCGARPRRAPGSRRVRPSAAARCANPPSWPRSRLRIRDGDHERDRDRSWIGDGNNDKCPGFRTQADRRRLARRPVSGSSARNSRRRAGTRSRSISIPRRTSSAASTPARRSMSWSCRPMSSRMRRRRAISPIPPSILPVSAMA